MAGFKETPSFYESNESFIKYLGKTSYYCILQECVKKITTFINPKEIMEFGFGTGATSIMLASLNKDFQIKSIDLRKEMKHLAEENAINSNISNIEFMTGDFVEYVKTANNLPEFLVLLYSFHHVIDPIENKVAFLKNCFSKMPDQGRLCIAETFLPEAIEGHEKPEVTKLWGSRILEAYASTFWASLPGLDKKDIEFSKNVARYSLDNEARAGILVSERDNEYLVRMGWLVNIAKEIGFEVEISEYCNSVSDGVVLLKANK